MSSPSLAAVSLYDARPFFEKALQFGIKNGLLDQARLDVIADDAPKGMVQIARYFGNENLRPELEKAKDRLVNLVSLYLEQTSHGDLKVAAESLRDYSFLSHSKGGSEMLKRLIVMPKNSHFGMNERGGFTDKHIPLLAKWSLRSLADYQVELAQRSQVAQVVDAAIWLADNLGLSAADLEDAGKDAEAVIRTALLMSATQHTDMPDWVAFEKIIVGLRKKRASTTLPLPLPKNLPISFKPVVQAVRQSVQLDLPKILDTTLPIRKLFDQTPAFMGRYFWIEDGLSEVEDYDDANAKAWEKATDGHHDDGSLLTLFLGVAAGSPPKTWLTEKGASALIRKIRKNGWQPDLAHRYIQTRAPVQHQEGYAQLWTAFSDEAQGLLQSDSDYKLTDALALLRRECHVK